ncbi:MAG TPA: hypothetical protein VGI60_05840 [Chthoniobacterales bacterium]
MAGAHIKIHYPDLGAGWGFRLVDYAWGDPGDPISAGQTSFSGAMVDAAPLDGSLGFLALGGTGLDEWRKERAKSVSNRPWRRGIAILGSCSHNSWSVEQVLSYRAG